MSRAWSSSDALGDCALIFVLLHIGPVAQWIRHRSTEPEIVGSSPTRVIFECSSGSVCASGCLTYVYSTLVYAAVVSVVGLVVRISAFQADGPGSIPGRRSFAPSCTSQNSTDCWNIRGTPKDNKPASSIRGLVVEYSIAIAVTRVRFPADARYCFNFAIFIIPRT